MLADDDLITKNAMNWDITNLGAILYAPTKLTTMQKDDRIRACYQHTCLYYVNNKKGNNRSIRERFGY